MLLFLIVFLSALQLLEPVLDASDPALAVAQHYATVSDSCYRTGSCAEATKESAEGLKALALYIDASKINTIWKALPLFGGVAYELMRHITHRMRIGLWADSTIVQVRGAEKYYMDIANLSFLVCLNKSQNKFSTLVFETARTVALLRQHV